MQQRITLQLSPSMKIEVEAADTKALIEKASFWSELPTTCPKCGASLNLFYRDPQGNSYYGLACSGPVKHESNFGISKQEEKGLFYKGEWQDAYGQGGGGNSTHSGTPEVFEGDPVAKNLGDMVTAKQLGMIRAVSRDKGVDADEMANGLFQCSVGELSKAAASSLIEQLLATGEAVAHPQTPQNKPPTAAAAKKPAPALHDASCTCSDCVIPF